MLKFNSEVMPYLAREFEEALVSYCCDTTGESFTLTVGGDTENFVYSLEGLNKALDWRAEKEQPKYILGIENVSLGEIVTYLHGFTEYESGEQVKLKLRNSTLQLTVPPKPKRVEIGTLTMVTLAILDQALRNQR